MSEIKKRFTPESFIVEFTTTSIHEGKRLDQFVIDQYPNFSRQFVKRKIDKGEIIISGRNAKHKPSTKIHSGDTIKFTTYKGDLEQVFWKQKELPLNWEPEILYDDQNLVVINKPPFMSTHPTGTHLFYCATTILEAKLGHTIHSVHRLDRETSGALVLGKNPEIANKMMDEFIQSRVKKCYFFIAHNKKDPQPSFTAKERLGRKEGETSEDENRMFMYCYPEDSKQGKHAETKFVTLAKNNDYVVGLAFPKTGRQHQIRSHAWHHGLPLVGDKLYLGGQEMFSRFKERMATDEDYELIQIPRHALHAYAIRFNYQNKELRISAPIPADLSQWMREHHFVEKDIGQKINQILEEHKAAN